MSVPPASRGSSSNQIAVLLLLIDTLHDFSTQEPTLINQARNELALLRSVLDATRAALVLLCVDYPVVALDRALDSCHLALAELEELHQRAREVGPVNPLSDIRGRLASLIFELNVMNVDMMMYVWFWLVFEVLRPMLTYFQIIASKCQPSAAELH